MPSISIFDNYGTVHHLTSGNPSTIAAWLLERLALCSDGTVATAPVRMEVYPQEVRGVLDWPMQFRSLNMNPEDVNALALVLQWIADGRSTDHQKLATLFQGLANTTGNELVV